MYRVMFVIPLCFPSQYLLQTKRIDPKAATSKAKASCDICQSQLPKSRPKVVTINCPDTSYSPTAPAITGHGNAFPHSRPPRRTPPSPPAKKFSPPHNTPLDTSESALKIPLYNGSNEIKTQDHDDPPTPSPPRPPSPFHTHQRPNEPKDRSPLTRLKPQLPHGTPGLAALIVHLHVLEDLLQRGPVRLVPAGHPTVTVGLRREGGGGPERAEEGQGDGEGARG